MVPRSSTIVSALTMIVMYPSRTDITAPGTAVITVWRTTDFERPRWDA